MLPGAVIHFVKATGCAILMENFVGYISIEPHLSEISTIAVTLMPSIVRFVLLTYIFNDTASCLAWVLSKMSYAISWNIQVLSEDS